jgi:hypothetical protein
VASSSDIEKILSISEGLFTAKRSWDTFCQEIAEYTYPIRATFTKTAADVMSDDYASLVMDSTSINVREELGNSIGSMLRQGEWFEIGTGDDDRDHQIDAMRSLQHASKLYRAMLKDRRSNWEAATKEADMDWVAFGQPVLSVTENATRDFIRFNGWHPALCAWILDADGKPCVLHRKFKQKAYVSKQLYSSGRWTGEMPSAVAMAAEKEPNKEFDYIHVMMPAEELYGGDGKAMRGLRGKKYISLYIDVTNRKLCQETPEPLFGYITPGWRRLSGMSYGFSPAAVNSLPDIRTLQAMARIILEQGEKAIDPPTVGSVEVFTRDVNLYAGGFTYVDMPEGASLRDVMSTINTSDGLRQGLELKQDLRALITDAFLLNKLYLPSSKDMRELEVAVRTEEFRRAALPFFTPIESEYHTAILEEGFSRATLMGIIPVDIFPSELHGADVHFTFNSPLNEAEGKKLVESYNTATQIIAAGAQVDQTIANLFDMRTATIDAVRGGGAPATWMISPKERKAKDAEAQAAKALATASQIANSGAATLSNVSQAKLAGEQAGLINGAPGAAPAQPALPAPAPAA